MGKVTFQVICLILTAFHFYPFSTSFAQPIPGSPKWDLSKYTGAGEEGTYEETAVFTLRPPDSRPPVNIAQSTAKQVLAGTMSPEVAYGAAGGASLAGADAGATKGEDEYTYRSRGGQQVEPSLGSDPSHPSAAGDATAAGAIAAAGASGASGLPSGSSGLVPSGGAGGGGGLVPQGGVGGGGGPGFKPPAAGGLASSGANTSGKTIDKNSTENYGQRSAMEKDSAFMAGVSKSLTGAYGAGAAGVASAGGSYFNANAANNPTPECVAANYKGTLCQGSTGQGNAAMNNYQTGGKAPPP